MPNEEKPTESKTCRCGYQRGHYMVAEDKEYTVGGWVALIFGVSATPRRTLYRCTVCKEVLAVEQSSR